MALKTIKTLAKLTIGVGAVYVTLDQGVWSSSNQGFSAVEKVRTTVLPGADDYVKQVPTAQTINTKIVETWNRGVHWTFEGLASAPSKIGELSVRAVEEVKQRLK